MLRLSYPPSFLSEPKDDAYPASAMRWTSDQAKFLGTTEEFAH